MKRYFILAKKFAFTDTAKDTYIIFSGNLLSAFLGFAYTLVAARALTIYDFGVLSAVINLVYLLSSLTDLGISNGIVNFVSKHKTDGKSKEADEYIKSALLIRLGAVILVGVIFLVNPLFFAKKFMATDNKVVTFWAVASFIAFIFYNFFPYILQAKREFFKSALVENSYGFLRLFLALVFILLGTANLSSMLFSFTFANLGPLLFGIIFVGLGFLFTKPNLNTYINLLVFSGWLGIGRMLNSISGRLDLQMLASMKGAFDAGIYSVPSRLTLFIIVLAGSFSAVLAPRLSSFGNKEKERSYIFKATLALLPVVGGVLIWILIAHPFIVFLFGEKFAVSVPVFRLLALSTIPFLMTAPATTAIIYAMRKTLYVGFMAFPQMILIFLLNYYFIPKYGVLGPAYTLIIVNTLVFFYLWFIVLKNYLPKDEFKIES